MHLRTHHAVYGRHEQKLICGQNGCLKTFTLMNSLLQHIKRKHSNINVLQNAEWNQGDDERNDLEY